ncbi:MAG: PAS domain S-box protein, partial [Cyclobacteriaceae bacterium]
MLHADIQKASKGKPLDIRHTIEDHQGKKHWLHLNYTPILDGEKNMRFSLAFVDITNEVQLKKELADNEKLLRSVFNSASVGLIVMNSNGEILKVNKTYCDIFGYQPSEVATHKFTYVVPIEQRKKVEKQFKDLIFSRKNFDGEMTLQKKDGALIEVMISSVLLEKENEDDVLLVTSIRDISESKKIRNLLVETQESMQVGGWELDLITNINTWTEEVYHIYEVSPDFDVNVENGLSYYDRPGREKLETAMRNAIEKGEAFDLELPFTSARNTKKWVRATCKPIRSQHRTIRLYGTIQDITSRKLYQERLIRITNAVESSSDAILITDGNGNLIYANKSYLKLLEYQLEEINEAGGIFAVYEDKALGKKIFNSVKQGNSWNGELNLVTKKGKIVPVNFKNDAIRDESGDIIGIMAIITDISMRKKHQEYLRLMESVVVNTNDAVIITEALLSDEGSKIVYVNSAFSKMTGYSREEVLGVTHRILHGPRTNREELAKIRRALVKRIPATAEIVNYRKDGSEFWVNFSIVPIVNEHNIITHHISIQRDVTDRKLAEEELKTRYHELEKTNMELDRFVYSASHDLRAPLASVLGLINLVKMDEKEKHHLEYLANMEKSIRKLDNFISDIINYSRNSRLEITPESIDLEELVNEIKEDLVFMENACKIRIEFEGKEKMISTDKARLRVVLSNLISNAIKYHNLRRDHPYIMIKYEKKDNYKYIRIIDNGPGIAKEHQENIFKMFYRGSESSSGSGLGLYIVKETLLKLRGDISLESQLGEGSTFTLKLPDNEEQEF